MSKRKALTGIPGALSKWMLANGFTLVGDRRGSRWQLFHANTSALGTIGVVPEGREITVFFPSTDALPLEIREDSKFDFLFKMPFTVSDVHAIVKLPQSMVSEAKAVAYFSSILSRLIALQPTPSQRRFCKQAALVRQRYIREWDRIQRLEKRLTSRARQQFTLGLVRAQTGKSR